MDIRTAFTTGAPAARQAGTGVTARRLALAGLAVLMLSIMLVAAVAGGGLQQVMTLGTTLINGPLIDGPLISLGDQLNDLRIGQFQ